MSDLFDFNARASDALVGGAAAEGALGIPQAGLSLGRFAPGQAQTAPMDVSPELALMRQRTAAMQQPAAPAAPASPPDPLVGYNPTTKRVFSAGQEFELDVGPGMRALQAGLLDQDNDPMGLPQGYLPLRSSQVRIKLKSLYDNLGLIDATQRRLGQMAAGYGSTLRDLTGDSFGQGLEAYGQGIIENNPSKIESVSDIPQMPGQFAREAVGQVIPDVGMAVGGAAAGAAAGAALAPATLGISVPVGAILGGVAGRYFPQLFETYGSVRREQREQGLDERGKALTAAAGSAALESLLGPEAKLGAQIARGTAREALESTGQVSVREARDLLGRSAVRRYGTEAAKQAAIEGPLTEVPQSAMERWGASKDLTGPDALNEYGLGAAFGAMAGGVVSPISSTVEYLQAKGFIDRLTTLQNTAADPSLPAPQRLAAARAVQDIYRGQSADPQLQAEIDQFRAVLPEIDRALVGEATADALAEGAPVDLLSGERDLAGNIPPGQPPSAPLMTQPAEAAPAQDIDTQPMFNFDGSPTYAADPSFNNAQELVLDAQQASDRATEEWRRNLQGAELANETARRSGELAAAFDAQQRAAVDARGSTLQNAREQGLPVVSRSDATRGVPRAAADVSRFSPAAAPSSPTPTPAAAPKAAQAKAVAAARENPLSQDDLNDLKRTLDDLEATVASGKGGVRGRVTLPQGVLAGIMRTLRSGGSTVAYADKGNVVDPGRTAQYGEQMRAIVDAANAVMARADALFNAQSNLIPTESKSRKKLSDQEVKAQAAVTAQDLRALQAQLSSAVDQLRAAAGNDMNVEAVVAVLKKRVQKIESKSAKKAKSDESKDTLLSRAWAMYKDGDLAQLEGVDVTRGRETRLSRERGERGAEDQPLVAAAAEGYSRRVTRQRKGETDKAFSARQEAAKEKGVLGILAYLQRHGSGFERLLASSIGRALRRAGTANAPQPELKFIPAGETPRYDPKTNTVYIHETASPEEALHESLHAALQWYVYQNPDSPEVNDLRAALKTVLDFKGDMPPKAREVVDVLRKVAKGRSKTAELDAVLELISYGSTLREFRNFLKTMPSVRSYEDKDFWFSGLTTLWKKVTALVQTFLGVSNSIANDVLDSTVALLEQASIDAEGPTGKRRGNTLQMVDTDTAAFKRWFGNSKVVRSDGTPQLMYHGTARDITKFEPKQANAIFVTNDPNFADLFSSMSQDYMAAHASQFLTPEQMSEARDVAISRLRADYGRDAGPLVREIMQGTPTGAALGALVGAYKDALPTGPNIMPVYVSAQNPFDYRSEDHRSQVAAAVRTAAYEQNLVSGEGTMNLPTAGGATLRVDLDTLERTLASGRWDLIESDLVQGVIRRKGFDGFYVKEGGQHNLAVYNPSQVKSAVGNTGRFDPNIGNILLAEVSSYDNIFDTVDDLPAPKYQKYVNRILPHWLSTEVIFNKVRWNERVVQPLTRDGGVFNKVSNWIINNQPMLARWISLVHSRFGIDTSLATAFTEYKNAKQAGYKYAERIARVLETDPNLGMEVLQYLDGDTSKLKDNDPLREVADRLKKWRDEYVQDLPEDQRRFFMSLKFSEGMVFAKSTTDVASRTFGARDLRKLAAFKTETIDSLDSSWIEQDDDGNMILDGRFYRVLEKGTVAKGGTAGFISEWLARQYATDPAFMSKYEIEPGFVWQFDGRTKTGFKFAAAKTLGQAMQEPEAVANALRNTMAILAGTYASVEFSNQIAQHGYVKGRPTANAVVFDDEDAIEAVFGYKPAEGSILKASQNEAKSRYVLNLYRSKHQWVQVPKGAAYGPLAGKLMSGSAWNAMQDMSNRQPLIGLQSANDAMRYFKKAKTVYNIGTHLTNVATNFTLALLHDISPVTVGKAARLLALYEISPGRLTAEERRAMLAFMDSNAMIGDFSSVEVKQALYEAMRETMAENEPKRSGVGAAIGQFSAYEKAKAQFIKRMGGAGKLAERVDDIVTQTYAAEDNAFRLAAFLTKAGEAATARGGAPTDADLKAAGDFAKWAFLDYDIDAFAIRALRQTAMPFISWTYAIAPVIGHIALHKPWKILNLWMGYWMLEQAMQLAAGDDDEEDERKRKVGPEHVRDRLFGFGPYTHIRVPFMGDDDNPVYYRLGAYIPLSTYTDTIPNSFLGLSGWPAPLTPGGPFISGVLALLAGVDPYTGRPLASPTASDLQDAGKRLQFMASQFTPNLPLVSSTELQKLDDLVNNKQGVTGVDLGNLQLARWAGLKMYDYHLGEAQVQQQLAARAIMREFQTEIGKLKRAEARMETPDWEGFMRKRDELLQRMQERMAEAQGEE